MVRHLNIDGDGQGDLAGHGGEQRAVLVYQAGSYHHWQQHFGRDDLGYGSFGENLTVDGLADDDVCIGDRYRIGDAEFEVTQPRVTCFRVGMRLGEPRMPALLVAHHRPGFYLRVIVEGQVRAGAEAGTGVPAPAIGVEPGWPGFRRFRVAELVPETATVTSVYLAADDGGPLPPALAGQYVTLRAAGAGDPAPVRSYSLSSGPGARMYRISVKREPHGVVSTFLNTRLRPGTPLDVAAPRGEFVLTDGTGPVLLVSAGVGATPVLAMLHQLAATNSGRDVWWIYAARAASQHAFAAEAHRLLQSLPSAHERIFYTAADAEVPPGSPVIRGRPTLAALAGLDLPADATAYLCGPAAFMADVRDALVALGVEPDRVHTELFGALPAINPGVTDTDRPAPHQPPGPAGTGPQITFARSGLIVRWSGRDRSLLELADACDVPTRWSCRTGVCHTCVTPILAGDVDYAPDPLEPPGQGEVLVCCSQPDGDVVLDL